MNTENKNTNYKITTFMESLSSSSIESKFKETKPKSV